MRSYSNRRPSSHWTSGQKNLKGSSLKRWNVFGCAAAKTREAVGGGVSLLSGSKKIRGVLQNPRTGGQIGGGKGNRERGVDGKHNPFPVLIL